MLIGELLRQRILQARHQRVISWEECLTTVVEVLVDVLISCSGTFPNGVQNRLLASFVVHLEFL